jgi:hypothetical protein
MTPDLILTDFDPAHVRLMELDRPEMSGMVSLEDVVAYASRLAAAGPAFSLFDKRGLIVASAGVGVYWRGVGEGWLILSSLAEHFMFSVHALIKRGMAKVVKDLELKRLQIVVPVGSDRAVNWAHRLGFCWEGKMEKYGPDGADYHRFARCF